jgi:hypothetical protein
MARDDSQRTDYEKKGSKEGHTEKLEMISGGHSSDGNNGPTGSSRHYPKGKGSPHKTDWNPQKTEASTYGICGVGHD